MRLDFHGAELASADGHEAWPRALPGRMDDWSKVDYYRFCLFQRQVQQEFLRENHSLRARVEAVAPGNVRHFLAEQLRSQQFAHDASAPGMMPEVPVSRRRPAPPRSNPEELQSIAAMRRRRRAADGPAEVAPAYEVEARVADGQSWQREVELLAESAEGADPIVLVEDSGSTAEQLHGSTHLESWRAGMLAAARGAGPGTSHVPDDSPRRLVASSPEGPECSSPAEMELTPSRRNSGRSGSADVASPRSASRRSRLPSAQATPQRPAAGSFAGNVSMLADGVKPGGVSASSAVPPSGDKGRRPRARLPGDLRSLAQLRRSVLGVASKDEIIKDEVDMGDFSAQRRDRA